MFIVLVSTTILTRVIFTAKNSSQPNMVPYRYKKWLSTIFILGAVHWIMDPDPDPSLFIRDLRDANKKKFFSKLFRLLLSVGVITSVLKDKKSPMKSLNRSVDILWVTYTVYQANCSAAVPSPSSHSHVPITVVCCRPAAHTMSFAKVPRHGFHLRTSFQSLQDGIIGIALFFHGN